MNGLFEQYGTQSQKVSDRDSIDQRNRSRRRRDDKARRESAKRWETLRSKAEPIWVAMSHEQQQQFITSHSSYSESQLLIEMLKRNPKSQFALETIYELLVLEG